jgi:nucleoside-diphosphate-sugar epimerase
MSLIENEDQLETRLATPNAKDIEVMRRLSGDIVLLGAGGKMGPSLARRIQASIKASGVRRRVVAVSRFSSPAERELLESSGIETIVCDLIDHRAIAALPDFENVFFLAGRKFGSSGRSDLTWAMNTIAPGYVADRFRHSRIVAFSTGNVYPFVEASTGGSKESDATDPRGEYAQSCLGRERVFEYFSHEFGTKVLIYRLNYAVDLRYGTLVDIAKKVWDSRPVELTVSHFNTIWQGDANSYALQSIEHCESPPKVLNVTGPEIVSVREIAEYYGRRFGRSPEFRGEESGRSLLNNSSLCYQLFGRPEVSLEALMELVAHWVEIDGRSLNKPTKFEVSDGKF